MEILKQQMCTLDFVETEYFPQRDVFLRDTAKRNNSFFHSPFPIHISNENTFENEINSYLKEDRIHKQAIEYRKRFDILFEEKKTLFSDIDRETINFCILSVISNIMECNPLALNIEITEDISILFTAKCDNFNLYFDLYFDNEIGDYAETVINVYQSKQNIYSFGGSFLHTIKDFKNSFLNAGKC